MNNRLEQKMKSETDNSNIDSNMNMTSKIDRNIKYSPKHIPVSVYLKKLDKFYTHLKKKKNKSFVNTWIFDEYILLGWLDDPLLAENIEVYARDIRKKLKNPEPYLEELAKIQTFRHKMLENKENYKGPPQYLYHIWTHLCGEEKRNHPLYNKEYDEHSSGDDTEEEAVQPEPEKKSLLT